MSAGTLTSEAAETLRAVALAWRPDHGMPFAAAVFTSKDYGPAEAFSAWKRYAALVKSAADYRRQAAVSRDFVAGIEARAGLALKALAEGPGRENPRSAVLPPERTVKCAVVLAMLACHVATACTAMEDAHIAAVLRVCSPIEDDAGRDEAWAEYLARVRVEIRLDDGIGDPSELLDDDELAGPEVMETARLRARERSAEQLDVLTGRLG